MIISAPDLFIGGAFTGPGAVAVEDGLITAILPGHGQADVELTSGFLAPGLIDIHNNGAFGVDFCTASPAQWDEVISRLAACGVTSVLPTIITAPFNIVHAAAACVAAAMARHPAILGLHLEGPFLAPAKRGAHRRDWLQTPTAEALESLLADPALRQVLRVITLAPELPGALKMIRELAKAGVKISLGHSDADTAHMLSAAEAGASLVTHVFNGQSALHHREPGGPGVSLTDKRLHPCIIVDGIHVNPMILNIAFAACPRAIAVTDSIIIAGQPEGTVQNFGGAPVRMVQNIGRRPDGTISGGGITLDEGVRRMIAAGIAPEIALEAATARPADALGLVDRGRIAVGQRADLIWWSGAYEVRQVWTAGQTDAAAVVHRGTEHARADLHDIDTMPTAAIIKKFLAQEQAALAALWQNAGRLAMLADAVAAKLAAGGRLFYAGAGTSGRLGLLDAVECGPTFGIPDNLIIPILAGGDGAFLKAVEGAEDNAAAAVAALRAHDFSAGDALIGIAASGSTPFTLAAITHANQAGGFTGAIVNNPASKIAQAAQIAIEIDSGPEVIAGSTRLSAGSTQKIALNIISSTVMIRLGKVFGPYMVDLRATNQKLRRRAISMTACLAEADEGAAQAALEASGFHVKTAVLVLRQQLSPAEAQQKLQTAQGSLRKALMTTP